MTLRILHCPTDEVKHVYESADIIADEFPLGHCGLFAIMAIALGKQ